METAKENLILTENSTVTDREKKIAWPAFAAIGLATFALTALCFGPFKIVTLISAAAATVIALVCCLPIEYALFFYFGYLFLDGALKVNSNYNPLLHVGQDLLLIILFIRSCTMGPTPGLKKFLLTPGAGLCVTLLLWIGLQYVNPFSLGLLPSLAGTKIYVSMILLYALIYHHLPRERIPDFLRGLVILAAVEGALAVVEYLYGEAWMMRLHPLYASMIMEQFSGIAYRPYGTTAVPGGPSIWIMLAAPIAAYLIAGLKNSQRKRLDLIVCTSFVAVGIPALIFCQVRVAIVLALVSFATVFLIPSRRFIRNIALTAGFFAAVFFAMKDFDFTGVALAHSNLPQSMTTEQKKLLISRTLSLTSVDTYMTARSGAWEEMLSLAQQTTLGIGLSRVGAASGVWRDIIAQDPYFGLRWTYADNLFKAIFTELGILGLLSWLAVTGGLIGWLLLSAATAGASKRKSIDSSLVWTAAISAFLLLLSGIGNEGVLYNPVSGFFWTFLALGAKEVHNVS